MAPLSAALESAEFIVSKATDVSIPADAVLPAADKLEQAAKDGAFALANWRKDPPNPSVADDAALDWIFLVDTLNFSFWSDDDPPFTVTHDGRAWTGYWSLCASVNRALHEGVPFTSAEYMANITEEQFRHVFRSETLGQIPLLEKRLDVLHEAGSVLIEKFGGSIKNVIKQAGSSAQAFIKLVTDNFSSYRDVTTFCGREVCIHKRVQILVADVWACFEGEGHGTFTDIATVTMFADYRVPQILVAFGLLKYSDRLMEKMRNKELIPPGDPLEVEIRGSSIWAVELVRRELAQRQSVAGAGYPMNAITLDFYLWTHAKALGDKIAHIPIHRTRTIFY